MTTDAHQTVPARLQCGPDPLPDGMAPSVVMWDLNARDAAKARDFYRAVFGWPISGPGDPPVELAVVDSGEGGINGVIGQAPRPGDEDEGIRHQGLIMSIKVRDVGAALRDVEANGGRTILGPDRGRPEFLACPVRGPRRHSSRFIDITLT